MCIPNKGLSQQKNAIGQEWRSIKKNHRLCSRRNFSQQTFQEKNIKTYIADINPFSILASAEEDFPVQGLPNIRPLPKGADRGTCESTSISQSSHFVDKEKNKNIARDDVTASPTTLSTESHTDDTYDEFKSFSQQLTDDQYPFNPSEPFSHNVEATLSKTKPELNTKPLTLDSSSPRSNFSMTSHKQAFAHIDTSSLRGTSKVQQATTQVTER